jgi:AcrR family transcriptional regulator
VTERVSRAADFTRRRLIEAGLARFARHGFDGASVRAIAEDAQANQAAIKYHFGTKDGLYREVLIEAFATFERFNALDGEALARLTPPQALEAFLRQNLSAILSASDLRGPLGVVNWEIVNRTPVFTQVVATRRIPVFEAARRIVGLFQPGLSAEEAALTAVWLVNQPFIFVRNAEQMRHPPVSVTLDEAGVERLGTVLTRLVRGGLEARA